MPLILYAFTLNTETQEASMIGNVPGEVALQLLQRLVVAELVRTTQEKELAKETPAVDNLPSK